MNFKPLGVCWVITTKCNYKCPFCYALKNVNSTLTLKKAKDAILKLKKIGVKYISFTGGEPTLEKNILKIIQFAHKQKFFIDFCTNGKLLPKIKSILKYINQISIPLDGSTNKIAKKIRFEDNLVNIFKKFIGLAKKHPKLKIRVNTLVCKNNIKDLNNIEKILNKYNNITWKLLRYYWIGNNNKNYNISKQKFKTIIQKINTPIIIKDQKYGYKESFISMDANFNIYIVHKNKRYIIGNLFDKNLVKKFNDNKLFNKKGHIKKYSKYL